MKTTFELSPRYTLKIETVGAREVSDPGVFVSVICAPEFSGHCSPEGGYVDESKPGWDYGMHFRPSFIRALASALLSAATEVQQDR